MYQSPLYLCWYGQKDEIKDTPSPPSCSGIIPLLLLPNITGGLIWSCKITSVPPACPLVDRLMSNATAPEDTAGVCMGTLVRTEPVFVMSLKVQCRNNFHHLLKGIHLLETSLCRKERNPASVIHFVSSTSTRKVI